MINVTEENFSKEVIENKKTTLVDFNASWCGPCRMLSPILKEISEENKNITIASVNVDENENLASIYQVSSIPCLVLIKDGVEIKRNVGFLNKNEIERFISQ